MRFIGSNPILRNIVYCSFGTDEYYACRKSALDTLTRVNRFFNLHCGLPEYNAKKADIDYIVRHSLANGTIDKTARALVSKQKSISGIQSLVENVMYCKLHSLPLPEVTLSASTEKVILSGLAPQKIKKIA